MTKGKKKTNRRLKKTVRKTLGTLFLISAIVVAAIPTEGLRAEEEIATQAGIIPMRIRIAVQNIRYPFAEMLQKSRVIC